MPQSVLIYDRTKIVAELCRREFSFFVKEFWSIIIAEELVWEPHMELLCNEIQVVYERVFLRQDPENAARKIRLPKENDLIINIPPGTSKSTIATIMAPAWAWTKDPSVRCITGSYSDSLATEHSTKSRDIVTCDKYRLYFPEVEIKDHKGLKSNYETTANGQRYATSVGGSVTGVHAHVITVDDPLNPKQAASQVECKAANEWMDKTLSLRKVDKKVTPTIVIMQRLAVNDVTGHLLEKKKGNVRLICLPAEMGDNISPAEYRAIYSNGLLSPLRMGYPQLAEARKDLGSSGYAGQMQQRPAPEGGTIWQKWFIEVPDEMFPDINSATQVQNDWDLAYTKDEKNSASAYITSGVIGPNIFIFDFNWDWKEYPEQIKWMKQIGWPHYIENKGPGKSAKQSLKKAGVLAIEVKVNRDKIARAKDATPAAEAGHVYIRKSMADRLYNDPKQGILFFPNGQHNDLADTLSQMIVRRTKKGSIHSSADQGSTPPAPAQVIADENISDNPLDWV